MSESPWHFGGDESPLVAATEELHSRSLELHQASLRALAGLQARAMQALRAERDRLRQAEAQMQQQLQRQQSQDSGTMHTDDEPDLESEPGSAISSPHAAVDSPRVALLSMRRQLRGALAQLQRERDRIQSEHARQVQTAEMLLRLQVSPALNSASALFLSPLNAIAVAELSLWLLRSLEAAGAALVRPALPVLHGLRALLRDAHAALTTALLQITQRQADELRLGRRLLALGEWAQLYELMQRGVTIDLNADTGAEWTALQRLCAVDSPRDQRCVLLLLRCGLDPSDAAISHPERPAAISRARAVQTSAWAVGVQPSTLQDIARHAPRSIVQAELEAPFSLPPQPPSSAAVVAAHKQGGAGSGPSQDDSSRTPSLHPQPPSQYHPPPHVQFCVDLVEQWRLHSDELRGALADALLRLADADQPENPADSASAPSEAPALAAAATAAVHVIVLHVVGEYLDLQT